MIQTGVGAEPDRELRAAGWERRFLVGGDRVPEMVTLYRELGYEVLVEPVASEGTDPSCNACLSSGHAHHVIYTRLGPATGPRLKPPEE